MFWKEQPQGALLYLLSFWHVARDQVLVEDYIERRYGWSPRLQHGPILLSLRVFEKASADSTTFLKEVPEWLIMQTS